MVARLIAPQEEKKRAAGRAPLVLTLVLGLPLLVAVVASIIVPLLPKRVDASVVAQAQASSATPTASATPSPVPTLKPLDHALNVRVLFGHDDVGADISSGVTTAYRNANLPEPRVASWSQVKRDTAPVFAHANVGKAGDARTRLEAFATLVNDAPSGSIDVALVDLGSSDFSSDTDVGGTFNLYVATMKSLESAHPDVLFLYTTVPVTTENSWKKMDASAVTGLLGATQPVWQPNIARERYNSLIRERYQSSGRLFDIAALQARITDTVVAAKEHEGQSFFVMNPALATSDGRRLNATGSARIATELIRIVDAVTAK